MLTRFRIEVEELTVAETLEALSKYEDALLVTEAERYWDQWPRDFGVDLEGNFVQQDGEVRPAHTPWQSKADREDYRLELGARRTEEVISWDEGAGRYKGRRVVVVERIDLRDDTFVELKPSGFTIEMSGSGVVGANSGTNP